VLSASPTTTVPRGRGRLVLAAVGLSAICMLMLALPSAATTGFFCGYRLPPNGDCAGSAQTINFITVLTTDHGRCIPLGEFARDAHNRGYPQKERFACGEVDSGSDWVGNKRVLTPHGINKDLKDRRPHPVYGYEYYGRSTGRT